GVARLTVAELIKYEGIGLTKACQIVSAFELGRRARKPFDVVGKQICKPAELVEFFQYELAEEEVEKFAIVNLSSGNRVLSWEIVSVGILNASLVHPREVFKQAIRACSSSIIALHNHPSGNCTPSTEDFLITRRIYSAGELVGISLLDHIVIGGDGYYSFSEHGHLPLK
ncbi:MAG: DNA repair protein RadC, partial [Bacillota bacterium]|nr:DNA repair protein RadC [Bacillota bacterium]